MKQYIPYQESFICMGTVITQKLYGENAEATAVKAKLELKRLENMLSFFKDGSDVSKINRCAGREYVIVNKETFEIITKAVEYSELTEGIFDITAGPLIKEYGVMTGKEKVLSSEEIKKVLRLIGYRDILIDRDKMAVSLRNEGQMIDLGAIAKGYAADSVIEIYRKHNIESAFINIGGNVKVIGKKLDNTPWNVGIQNPFKQSGEYIGVVKIEDKTVVTSGDYERYFEKGGIKYHHIMNLMTGLPSESNLSSATLVCRNSMEADALSTACFIIGLDRSIALLQKFKEIEGIFITKDSSITITDGLSKSFFKI